MFSNAIKLLLAQVQNKLCSFTSTIVLHTTICNIHLLLLDIKKKIYWKIDKWQAVNGTDVGHMSLGQEENTKVLSSVTCTRYHSLPALGFLRRWQPFTAGSPFPILKTNHCFLVAGNIYKSARILHYRKER